MQLSLFNGPFYFMRHGESAANAAGLIAGAMESPLTERGRAQAEAAAALLSGLGIAAIFASPLGRAADTAQAAAAVLGLPIAFVDDLCERHWGVLENRPLSLIRDRSITAEGGESLTDFDARTWAALSAIRSPAPALVVAHAGTMRVLRRRLGIGDVPDFVGNAAPVRFEPADGIGAVWRFSLVGAAPVAPP